MSKTILECQFLCGLHELEYKTHGLLDETCEIESKLIERFEAYTYAKAKQDEIVMEYGRKHNIPYVLVAGCRVWSRESSNHG